MSGPSDRHFELNFGEKAAMPSQDNIWCPSFLFPTGPLTVGDSVMMKNDMTAAMVAKNLLTPKDNRLLSKRSNELAVKDSLAFSILLDHQRFVGLFQRHLLPSSSGVLPSTEAPNDHHSVPSLSGALLTDETSPEQPL
ncbi:hypothetical protein EV1_013303 [Malus domestica]